MQQIGRPRITHSWRIVVELRMARCPGGGHIYYMFLAPWYGGPAVNYVNSASTHDKQRAAARLVTWSAGAGLQRRQ